MTMNVQSSCRGSAGVMLLAGLLLVGSSGWGARSGDRLLPGVSGEQHLEHAGGSAAGIQPFVHLCQHHRPGNVAASGFRDRL